MVAQKLGQTGKTNSDELPLTQSQKVGNAPEQKKSKLWIFMLIGGLLLVFFFIILPIMFFFMLGSALDTSDTTTSKVSTRGTQNVALIQINGVIMTQTQASLFGGSSDTSSTEIVRRLKEIQNDPNIKGVIFEINSPGGSGVASDEISQAIKALDKPTVSYIREVGASGAYWVASSTDVIYANRMSTVGSIGVIASYLDFSDFLTRYNVTYQRFVAGDNKDFGSPFTDVTPDQRAHYQAILDELHMIFIEEVAQGRGLSVDEIKPYADGSIFTARQAIEAKLIDGYGGRDEAIYYMEQQLGSKVNIITYTRRASLFEALATYSQSHMYAVGAGIGDRIVAKQTSSLVMQT
jgi:protease IV